MRHQPRPRPSRPVILNADGTDTGRQAISRILRRQGFEVVEARSGKEALQLAAEGPDLVLLDVNLPDISGIEVCRRLKAGKRTSGTPVLHISSTPVPTRESVADGWLTEPVEPGLLVATVQALLRARQAEQRAGEAAHLTEITLNAIGHSVCLVDREGRVRQANAATAALAGRPVEEIIGRSYDELLPGAEQPAGGWPFERGLKSKQREIAEVRRGERWFQITADPILDARGRFDGAIRTVVELTQWKQAEAERKRLLEQIENERTRLEEVLQQMPAGVIIAEAPSGRVVLINHQLEALLRGPYKLGGVVGETMQYPLRRPGGAPYHSHEKPLARALANGEVVANEECEVVRGDGTPATLLMSSAPIRDRHGAIVAAVAAFHDVTERKLLEEQLRHSQKMEAVGRLAGGVAHDFNNLLTIISGYGQMVFDGLDARDPARKDMEAVLEAAARATALTRQLLTFSRRQVVEPRLLDLNRHVARLNRMLRRVIGEDIELSTVPRADPARIQADPSQLEQVIMNLAINSRDAMPDGGKLVIETANVEVGLDAALVRRGVPAGRYVLLGVADTGCGMDALTLSHALEPFFTTKGKGKGTGLGLATVYGIVKQAGGEILLDSQLGRGTRVSIYFPALDGKTGAETEPSDRASQGGSETILLVEDDLEVRRLASDVLQRLGYVVLQAATGKEALRLWRMHGESIDLLLADVIMPQMSGRELADKLKASRADLKVIYMSGYTDDVIARQGVQEQAAVLIHKPFTPDALARKVRAVLDKKV